MFGFRRHMLPAAFGLVLPLGCSAGSVPTFGSATFGSTDSNSDVGDADDSDPPTISASASGTTGNDSNSATSAGSASTGGSADETASTGDAEVETAGSSSTGWSPGVTSDASSSGPGSVCGNDIIEGDEACDGSDLGMLGCPEVNPMWTTGVLGCDAQCQFDETACSTLVSPMTVCSNPALAIPDSGTASASLNVPSNAVISDVEVHLEVTHTWISDLRFDIVHAGTTVVVFDRLCSMQPNIDADFDDQAGAAFNCASSAIGASYLPSQSLAAFNGLDMVGNWDIVVVDAAPADIGTLNEWCITVTFQ